MAEFEDCLDNQEDEFFSGRHDIDDYWFEQRYQDMYYATYGTFPPIERIPYLCSAHKIFIPVYAIESALLYAKETIAEFPDWWFVWAADLSMGNVPTCCTRQLLANNLMATAFRMLTST